MKKSSHSFNYPVIRFVLVPAMRLWVYSVVIAATLLAIGVPSAGAQVVFVSNLGQTITDWRAVGGNGGDAITLGMRFTTGAASVTVDKFTLSFKAPEGSPTGLELKLYDTFSSGVGPSGLLGTFTGSDPLAAGNYDYVDGATLAAHTSYFLIASAPSSSAGSFFNWRRTTSSAEDGGGQAGWSMGDTFIIQNSSFPTWSESLAGSLMFSAQGSAIPEPSTYALWFGAVAFGVVCWRRRMVKAPGLE